MSLVRSIAPYALAIVGTLLIGRYVGWGAVFILALAFMFTVPGGDEGERA